MADLISFPFRVLPSGQVAVSEEGTNKLYAEQLSVLAMTRPGERLGAPDFGTTDPIGGDTLDKAEMMSKIIVFGPPVTVTSVVEKMDASLNSLSLDITFEPNDYAVFGRE